MRGHLFRPKGESPTRKTEQKQGARRGGNLGDRHHLGILRLCPVVIPSVTMNTDFRFSYSTLRRAVMIVLCGSLLFGSSVASAGGLVMTSEGRVGSDDSGEAAGSLLAVLALAITIAPFAWTTKGLRGTQQDQAFHQRFSSDPRGVSKDLLRRRGKHYHWARKTLRVPARLSVAFDCSVADRRAELKARLKKAKSMNSEHSARVMQLLRDAYKKAQKRSAELDVCQLKARYFQDPELFKGAVLGPSRKGAKRSRAQVDAVRWILNTYLGLPGADTRYLTCQFRADRKMLQVAFQQIEKLALWG